MAGYYKLSDGNSNYDPLVQEEPLLPENTSIQTLDRDAGGYV